MEVSIKDRKRGESNMVKVSTYKKTEVTMKGVGRTIK